MRTFQRQDVSIRYYDGLESPSNVEIRQGEGPCFEVPMQALVEFVADLVSQERISRLEQAGPMEIFGFGVDADTQKRLSQMESKLRQLERLTVGLQKA